MTWEIPRLWDGATVAVLASGPSMSQEAADKVRAAGIPTIAVNTTFKLAPWADMLYAADAAWWHSTPQARKFAGLKVSAEQVDGVNSIGNAGGVGYTDHTMAVHTFGNSGAQAIQIAAKAGAARVLLLGMDMTGGHWHGPHPAPLRNTHQDTYEVWRSYLPVLADALRARGVEVVNCSLESAVDCWPKVALEDALAPRSAVSA